MAPKREILTALICLVALYGEPVSAGQVMIDGETGVISGDGITSNSPLQTGMDRARGYADPASSARNGVDVIIVDPTAPAQTVSSNPQIIERSRTRAQEYVTPGQNQNRPVVVVSPDAWTRPGGVIAGTPIPRSSTASMMERGRARAKLLATGKPDPKATQTVIILPEMGKQPNTSPSMPSNQTRVEMNTDKARAWVDDTAVRRPCKSATQSVGTIGDGVVTIDPNTNVYNTGGNIITIGGGC